MDKFQELKIEIEMALGFLRAFLEEEPGVDGDNFSDLYDDICDSYGALVDAQITHAILGDVYNNMLRKLTWF